MSSIIKVNTFQDANGNALFNSDGSGNVTLSSNDMKATPAFSAYLSSTQSISDNTWTVIQFDTEHFDTDSCYNTTNYRFTPNQAGWYYIHTEADLNANNSSEHSDGGININKNGSEIYMSATNFASNFPQRVPYQTSGIAYANGTTDYFTSSAYVNDTSGSPEVTSTSGRASRWCAFKIIGA